MEHGTIQAAIYAIETIAKNSIKQLCINTSDKGITEKAGLLKTTDWLKKDGRPYLMRDSLMHLDRLLRLNNDIIIRWRHIRDDDCIYELKMAEQLANLMLKRNK